MMVDRMRHNDHYNSGYHHSSVANSNKGKQLMSFANYVRTLNNNVDETTAFKKYKDFMANLSQTKVGRFFDANKDREWFRLKYHPIESHKQLQQQNLNFQKRLKIFNELNDRKYFDSIPLSIKYAPSIINLMDAIMIYLEGGPQTLIDNLLSSDETNVDIELRRKFVPEKPTSVIIDDLSIETTLAEIQECCIKSNPDLLRIAQLDPYYVEGGLLKRKVVAVYKDTVDIRDVCWKLSRTKLNNRFLSVHINKCLSKRIYSIEPISNHHISIINDIRAAIILILNFDELKGLYTKDKQPDENNVQQAMETDEPAVKIKSEPLDNENDGNTVENGATLSSPKSEKSVNEEDAGKPFDVSTLDEDREKEKKKLFEFRFNTNLSLHRQVELLNRSRNPVLKDAYIYLIDFIESSAAKYYITRVPKQLHNEDREEGVDYDKFTTLEMIAVNLACSQEESARYLDKLLWYLRIVHSFDYYKKALYRQEDELTLRIGVIHLRGAADDDTTFVASDIKNYLQKCEHDLNELGLSQTQKYVTKDEERFDYKSYGKVITDELASYSQKIQKARSTETEEVYKCKHCTRVFQKLSDIGRHFVSKHRWAIDAIELETDFFNTYLFDPHKINPSPPKEMLEVPTNRFAKLSNFSQMGEDPDLLQQTIEAYSKMESFVREPAPRAQVESDPRNDSIVDYADISFDDAI